MSKRHGLGRGLEALLATSAPRATESETLRTLPVDLIQRGRYQPRIDMRPDTLQELADSIRAQGVVQPVVVRPCGGERFELIAGERRWRAAQLAGLHEIPAVIRDVGDQAAMAMALIENIQREDLNPLEEAVALRRLIDEFGLTHQGAAEAVGRSRVAVSNLLRLLELDDAVKRLLESGQIEMGHARALLALPQAAQIEAALHVSTQALSVRETERWVARRSEASSKSKSVKTLDPNVRELQDRLGQRLGARVELRASRGGRGALVVHYGSLEELDGILAHIERP